MRRLQQIRHALGSDVVLTLVVAETFDTDEVFHALWSEINLFEHTFSRFLDDSELTYVNQRAGELTEISSEFKALVETSMQLSEKTDGLYNPFVLPKLQAAGYKGSWPNPKLYDQQLDFSKRSIVPATALQLSADSVIIPPESALDFGGIGKGYLLDGLADMARQAGVKDFWFSLGGDIITSGYDVDKRPWQIAIQSVDPEKPNLVIETDGQRMAIATSGTTKRAGTHHGKSWHHLIHPQTGQPANTDVLTATAVTKRAVDADVYAKCCVLLGSKQAKTQAKTYGLQAYVLQYCDKTGKIHTQKEGRLVR